MEAEKYLTNEEKVTLNCDVRKIDWKIMSGRFSYGIQRYFFKEDALPPETNYVQLLVKNQLTVFNDISFAASMNNFVANKDTSVYFPTICSSEKFKLYVASHQIAGSRKPKVSNGGPSKNEPTGKMILPAMQDNHV